MAIHQRYEGARRKNRRCRRRWTAVRRQRPDQALEREAQDHALVVADGIGQERHLRAARHRGGGESALSANHMAFPVSIKGVVINAGKVVLLKNERDEWELP